MIDHVRLIEADVPSLQFMLGQARLISSALSYVLASSANCPAATEVLLGADDEAVRKFSDRLSENIATARHAYDARESQAASRVRIPAAQAHLIHAALMVSTHLTSSEEEYNIQVGEFKENALKLASGILSAYEDRPSD
jgi:hypothetical protein